MIDWIIKNINPLGAVKKNRGALYRVIARVLGKMKDDAVKAFRAHFPLLADSKKLREHGKALSIPEMDSDTEDEYRKRVAGASFFLSRAGERSYILGQLREHFGSRFTSKEEFLRIFIKIVDLEDRDRKWVLEFLDTILDPNIFVSVAEWFVLIDHVMMNEAHTIVLHDGLKEDFAGRLYHNGRILRDGHTVRTTEYRKFLRDGEIQRSGVVRHTAVLERPARSAVTLPLLHSSGIRDVFNFGFALDTFVDAHRSRLCHSGSVRRSAAVTHNGIADASITEAFKPYKTALKLNDTIQSTDALDVAICNISVDTLDKELRHNGCITRSAGFYRGINIAELRRAKMTFAALRDSAAGRMPRNGAIRRNGAERRRITGAHFAYDVFRSGVKTHHYHNGNYSRNVSIKHDGMVLVPLEN